MTYETPTLSDYDDLAEVTAAVGSGSLEDAGSKVHKVFGSRPN